MDIEQSAAESHVKLAVMVMQSRHKRLTATTERYSRHYSKLAHTMAIIVLLEELQEMLLQDPDHWDDEKEDLPF